MRGLLDKQVGASACWKVINYEIKVRREFKTEHQGL